MIFTTMYEPRLDDYNVSGRLSPEAMLKILENAGMGHAERVRDKAVDQGIAWMLLEWRVVIDRRPLMGEKLRVQTWVHGKAPASTVSRDFLLTDEAGAPVIRAAARFVLVDVAAKRPVRVSQALFSSYGPEESAVFSDIAPHLKECESYDRELPLLLRRSDIDFNGHVHNTRYLDFAAEALSEEAYRRDHFSSLRLLYRLPLTMADTPVIRCREGEDGARFGIYAGGQALTLIEMLY